jgi:hypothetical protein
MVSIFNPISFNSVTTLPNPEVQKAVYVALASLGVGLAIGSLCVAPPVALAFGALATTLSVLHTVLYYREHPQEVESVIHTTQFLACCALGIFSKSFKKRALIAYKMRSTQPLTADRVIGYSLSVGSLAMVAASLLAPGRIGLVFKVVASTCDWIQWVLICRSQTSGSEPFVNTSFETCEHQATI